MHVHLPNNIQNQTCILAKKQLYQHLIHKHLKKKKKEMIFFFKQKKFSNKSCAYLPSYYFFKVNLMHQSSGNCVH